MTQIYTDRTQTDTDFPQDNLPNFLYIICGELAYQITLK